jgi:hypothetical protein
MFIDKSSLAQHTISQLSCSFNSHPPRRVQSDIFMTRRRDEIGQGCQAPTTKPIIPGNSIAATVSLGKSWLRVCRKTSPLASFHSHELISGSKSRIDADQVRKQPDFGIVGLSARHWLFSSGHTSVQKAVHAASITGYSCAEGCA